MRVLPTIVAWRIRSSRRRRRSSGVPLERMRSCSTRWAWPVAAMICGSFVVIHWCKARASARPASFLPPTSFQGSGFVVKNPNATEESHEDPDILLTRYKEECEAAASIRNELRQILADALERNE